MTEPLHGDKNQSLLCRRTDTIQGKQAQKNKGKTALRRAYLRALLKIKNKTPEIHRKLALWFCENYCVILLPRF